MTEERAQIIRVTTALNVAVLEDEDGTIEPKAAIKAMRDCIVLLASAVSALSVYHRRAA